MLNKTVLATFFILINLFKSTSEKRNSENKNTLITIISIVLTCNLLSLINDKLIISTANESVIFLDLIIDNVF